MDIDCGGCSEHAASIKNGTSYNKFWKDGLVVVDADTSSVKCAMLELQGERFGRLIKWPCQTLTHTLQREKMNSRITQRELGHNYIRGRRLITHRKGIGQ